MRAVTVVMLGLIAVFAPAVARAATQPYQGIYTIIDPYNSFSIRLLKTASTTTCASQSQGVTTPYCGATNGILLRMNWCDFQPYKVVGADGVAYPSCHYGVSYSNGAGSAGVEVPDPDEISPCLGAYDNCSGAHQSILGGTLALIAQIDQQRAKAGLAPLKLSLGLSAGGKTAQSVIDAVGYVDVPFTASSSDDPAVMQCLRMPLPWSGTYTSDFNHALDALISYVQAQLGSNAAIAIVKVSDISGDTLELDMPGRPVVVTTPVDPGSSGPGPAVRCSTVEPAAQTWLDAYNAAPVGKYTMSQADENSLGVVIGHALGTLANDGLAATLLSLPTTNGQAFPMVDCGITGASTCVVSGSSGNWTNYYMELYVDDLFDGGLAETAARNGYANVRSGTFSLRPSQFSVNWTGLSSTPLVPASQITCVLNNTVTANAPTDRLDRQNVQIDGVGTVIGWQSATSQGGECGTSTYTKMLNNGISNGATFLEVETDAAFTDIGKCSAPLTNALASVLKAQAPGLCQF